VSGDLRAQLLEILERKRREGLNAYGHALAQAVAETAPSRTGHLRGSVAYLPRSAGQATLRMVVYGDYVDQGTQRITPRYFVAAADRTAAVEAVRAAYPWLTFTFDPPPR